MFLALFLTLFSCSEKVAEAELIHWNDFHSTNLPFVPTYNNPDKVKVGGSAVLAGYIDSLRSIYSDAIVLNAGDDFQGSPVSSMTKGISQILLLNEIKPDAYTIGNHEFDYGKGPLKQALDKANFDVLSANIYDQETNELLVKPYQIYQKGDVKIAVIGLVYESLKSSVIPANVRGLKILNQEKTVRKYVKEVEDKSDLIVVLSHSGFYSDSTLAENLDEVDVIVGGHSHSWLSNPVEVNDILILQAGAKGERVGLLKMKVDKQQKEIRSWDYDFIRTIVNNVTPDEKVAALVDSMEKNITAIMDQEIGQLEKDWIRNSRDESNIGNWICDVTREKFNTDIAFQNSGGIRKNLAAGPITVRDIWEISPFDNTIQIFELTGQELLDMINYRLENPRDLLQLSGLQLYINMKKGTLEKATVKGKPINPEQTYSIATNNYVLSHSKRFFGIENSQLDIKETNVLGRDVMLEAIKAQKIIPGSHEDRIIKISQD